MKRLVAIFFIGTVFLIGTAFNADDSRRRSDLPFVIKKQYSRSYYSKNFYKPSFHFKITNKDYNVWISDIKIVTGYGEEICSIDPDMYRGNEKNRLYSTDLSGMKLPARYYVLVTVNYEKIGGMMMLAESGGDNDDIPEQTVILLGFP